MTDERLPDEGTARDASTGEAAPPADAAPGHGESGIDRLLAGAEDVEAEEPRRLRVSAKLFVAVVLVGFLIGAGCLAAVFAWVLVSR